MAKSRVILRSNFRAVSAGAQDAMQDAIRKATDEMEDTAERAIERANNTRGWNLPEDIQQETSADDGKISYDHFFGRWFEYGTVYIPPAPFMRPAHRKGRARLISELDDNFEGWIRRRAGRIPR